MYNCSAMTDLFDHALKQRLATEAPLAARMRPRRLEEYIGQDEIVGEGRLLRHVENGAIILIGATTENPYFEVIGALVSRSRVFQLRPLSDENVRHILEQALTDTERGYGNRAIRIDEDAIQHL